MRKWYVGLWRDGELIAKAGIIAGEPKNLTERLNYKWAAVRHGIYYLYTERMPEVIIGYTDDE
jgi:hypothetical protein